VSEPAGDGVPARALGPDGVAAILDRKRVCICAGPGGVGKTTTSAAIAAGMAARGRKVAVLTIDPAKRLADSLGLPELGNEARRVDSETLAAAGIPADGGELWAMMLDAKATFDEVIRENAPDAETRERILSNRIYQQLSAALAGSQEYMAMEKLYELSAEADYDLLVLDTPPSRNALDFLDAPRRLVQFIEGRALRVFMRPTGLASRMVGGGATMMFSILRRITGVDLLDDLAEFFQAFGGMVGGFRQRARKVNELLADERTCFLVVCAPQGEPISEAARFHRKLVEASLPFGGIVVNKVRFEASGGGGDGELEARVAAAVRDPELAARVVASHSAFRALAASDRANIGRLAAELPSRELIQVPYLDDDVHDLAGLAEINRYLFAAGADERAALAARR
jgi:anion-transporting  ArsA/GET3 family ATPase